MKKATVIIFLGALMLLFGGCGSKAVPVETVSVVKAWMPEYMAPNDPQGKAALYQKEIYYPVIEGNAFGLQFYSLTGEKGRRIMFPAGNGPGEVQPFTVSALKIVNERIYIVNLATRTLSLYDTEGEYLDDIQLNDEMGFIYSLDTFKDRFYFTGLFKNRIGAIDLKDGSLIKRVEYEDPITDMTKIMGSDLKTGSLNVDQSNGHIYLGYFNAPYRVEEYDEDLDLVRTMTRPLKEKYENLKVGGQGGGHILIASVKNDEKYIYACFGGGQKTTRDGGEMQIEALPRPFFVSVFDKASGQCVKEIRIDNIPVLEGVAGLVGVTKEHIVFLFADFKDTLKDVVLNGEDEKQVDLLGQMGLKMHFAFVVTDNPLYEHGQ
ncbi:MAG TPA: hypothetical protein ENN72_09150 [Firmicutes bacterium]|nr:hypothetical protein [Bacillota bacterium]